MGKPDAPTPPDPSVTAAAQTSTNVATAIANNTMQNKTQVSPWGRQETTINGYETVTDQEGNEHRVPRYTTTTTLPDSEMRALNMSRDAKGNLAQSAADRSEFLLNYLQKGTDRESLPDRVAAPGSLDMQYGRTGVGLRTDAPKGAGDVVGSIGHAGHIQDRQAQGGPISRSFGSAGDLRQIGEASGIRRDGVDGGPLQRKIVRGDIANGAVDGGPLQRKIARRDVASGIGGAGDIQSDFDSGQNVINKPAFGGTIHRNIQNTGRAQGGVALSGDITKSYGTDFSDDRQRVESAIMERMSGQQQRDKSALEARLANQGIGYGTAAYSAAMDDFNRGINDARLGAVIAGGQEQSRMTGLEAQRAGFENAAQGQTFGQNLTRTQMQNAAQGQNYQQALASGQFANQAQQQQYGQDANNIALRNAAQQQAFNQQERLGQFANQAQQQQYGQTADRARFANDAQAQEFGQNAAAAQLNNQATAQSYAQRAGNVDRQNAAQAQQFSQNAAAGEFNNRAAAQSYAQRAGNIDRQNAAQAQEFGQQATRADFANKTQQQLFGQMMDRTRLSNDATAQAYSQDAGNIDRQNAAQQQFFNQRADRAQLNNAAQQQRFAQDATGMQMQNAALQSTLDNYNRGVGMNNAISGDLFNRQMQRAQFQNDQRKSAMEEQFAYRNQPINEITALLSGSQVQAPNFSNQPIQGMPTVDYAGLINQNYQQRQQNYQSEMAQRQGLLGGLFGLGAAGIGAWPF